MRDPSLTLAGCDEKAEEIDDSSGSFGMFLESLYSGWIKARQAARSDADETAKLLLDRMEHDPYGFAYTLEGDAVKVMNKDGLAAFERQTITSASLENPELSPEIRGDGESVRIEMAAHVLDARPIRHGGNALGPGAHPECRLS